MYLFHTPVIVVVHALSLRVGWPLLLGSMLPVQLLFATICIGVTGCLAALSWKLYEQPILRLRRLFPVAPQRGVAAGTAPVDGLSTAA